MKFSVGDKVVMKRTGEEGHVTAYIDKEMIEVEVNGINFPVHIDEIDHPYLKWFTEKKAPKKQSKPEQLPVEKIKSRPAKLARGIYLSFLPVFARDEIEDIVEELKIYLLNELPQAIRFGYEVKSPDEGSIFKHEGKLHGFGDLYLHSIPYADMNDQPRFHWKVTDVENDKMKEEEGILRIRPAKLFEQINQLLKNNEATFSYLLTDGFVERPKEEVRVKRPEPVVKKQFITKLNIAALSEQPKYELDLHIEKLVNSKGGLSNAEIVQIQLDHLRKYLQLALVHRQHSMFIIHGVGKGVLKEEVHRVLRETDGVDYFENRYHGRYGYGATEVRFRY